MSAAWPANAEHKSDPCSDQPIPIQLQYPLVLPWSKDLREGSGCLHLHIYTLSKQRKVHQIQISLHYFFKGPVSPFIEYRFSHFMNVSGSKGGSVWKGFLWSRLDHLSEAKPRRSSGWVDLQFTLRLGTMGGAVRFFHPNWCCSYETKRGECVENDGTWGLVKYTCSSICSKKLPSFFFWISFVLKKLKRKSWECFTNSGDSWDSIVSINRLPRHLRSLPPPVSSLFHLGIKRFTRYYWGLIASINLAGFMADQQLQSQWCSKLKVTIFRSLATTEVWRGSFKEPQRFTKEPSCFLKRPGGQKLTPRNPNIMWPWWHEIMRKKEKGEIPADMPGYMLVARLRISRDPGIQCLFRHSSSCPLWIGSQAKFRNEAEEKWTFRDLKMVGCKKWCRHRRDLGVVWKRGQKTSENPNKVAQLRGFEPHCSGHRGATNSKASSMWWKTNEQIAEGLYQTNLEASTVIITVI